MQDQRGYEHDYFREREDGRRCLLCDGTGTFNGTVRTHPCIFCAPRPQRPIPVALKPESAEDFHYSQYRDELDDEIMRQVDWGLA